MSGLQGKNGRNIRKIDVAESNVPSVGFSSLQAQHEAAAGDTIIDTQSLVIPAESVANGETNDDLTSVNLKLRKRSVLVRTGTGTLIRGIDYVISGATTIRLLQPALDLQVFEITVISENRTATSLVDATPLAVTGILSAGQTDFNVGESFEINKFPAYQIGAIVVTIDGQEAYRKVGNEASGDGDYIEVASGSGVGQVLRFNVDLTEDRQISVKSIGSLVRKPDASVEAEMQNIAGQLELHRQILEEVTEEAVPQGAATYLDQKTFGDTVLGNSSLLQSILDVEIDVVEREAFYWRSVTPTFTSLLELPAPTETDGTASLLQMDAFGRVEVKFDDVVIEAGLAARANGIGEFLSVTAYTEAVAVIVAQTADESGGHTGASDQMQVNISSIMHENYFVAFDANANPQAGSVDAYVIARRYTRKTIREILGL